MLENILQTKLHIPPARSSFVPRQRLIDRLNAGTNAQLTLISAPAGYGKTTLVTAWLQGGQVKATWLSLDEGDNDPRRFLIYLLSALRQIDAGLGRAAEAMLQAPQPPPGDALMTTLVNELSVVTQPFILILDDYHVIHAPPIHQQLNFLLEHQPPQMHLVVISREDPPLPLPRLRARGQMVEIRHDALRFSLEECADFLNQVMGLNLPPGDISALERRTEGWIAGLQLAALSMRGRDDLSGFVEAFTGSSHYVLDYLIEEVFQQQSAEVQDFLLRTSILERLSGPLCDAVAKRTGSRELLERLEHANLFIIPLDQSCNWYRYHHLFADLLRQRLQMTELLSETELHRLASQWFEKVGFFAEAIQHSLAGSDWAKAAELIGRQAVFMSRGGEWATLLNWFKTLPEDAIYKNPKLCLDYGWALTITGNPDIAAAYLNFAEQAFQGEDELLGQVLAAQAYRARNSGAYPQAIALSRKALTLIPEADVTSRGLATLTLGFALCSAGHLAEAEPVLLDAYEAACTSGDDFGKIHILCLLGDIQSDLGKLHQAAFMCQQAFVEAHDSPIAAQIHVLLATILYEWNDLETADAHLTQALKTSQQIGDQGTEVDVYIASVRVKLAQRNPSAALEALEKVYRLLHDRDLAYLEAGLAILRAEIAVAQGDISSAVQWAKQMLKGIDPAELGLHTQVGLTQSEFLLAQSNVLLAQGKKDAAREILASLYEKVSQVGFVAVMIKIRAMQAVAATEPIEAFRFLAEALKLGQPEGFVRSFMDLGEPMRALLERLRTQGGELKPYVQTLLSAFGETGKTPRPQSLAEPISEREIEILRLLADGLSNQQIANRLVITVGTAKSHVHHILEKLETESRTQAVAKARELGLV